MNVSNTPNSTDRQGHYSSMETTSCTGVIGRATAGGAQKKNRKKNEGKKLNVIFLGGANLTFVTIISYHQIRHKQPNMHVTWITPYKIWLTTKNKKHICNDYETAWYRMYHNSTVQRVKCKMYGGAINSPVIWFDATNWMLRRKEYCDRTHRKQFALHNCLSWRSAPVSRHSYETSIKMQGSEHRPRGLIVGVIFIWSRPTDQRKHNIPCLCYSQEAAALCQIYSYYPINEGLREVKSLDKYQGRLEQRARVF